MQKPTVLLLYSEAVACPKAPCEVLRCPVVSRLFCKLVHADQDSAFETFDSLSCLACCERKEEGKTVSASIIPGPMMIANQPFGIIMWNASTYMSCVLKRDPWRTQERLGNPFASSPGCGNMFVRSRYTKSASVIPLIRDSLSRQQCAGNDAASERWI
ncbi:hypothetical protein SAICODRAFT_29357 [Saitoella complicata NRRL Y-17804]|uniref:uncharacterized protein n=1 Tax=Saitoella complicata (strain BCRC 22490 / CBS 7301 / JCM 7358 / NBRC 10748 / NRRL Y-17804) TaxID=698492 RepID=UPI0008675988|nr:uncharacterized protein SAICODRAFT_29357 [Saitoella complicata NRRL Y-17804]ODQ54654.1 hypothetical protein SAICODRAFT_29357 [Saitoella complicata NRRL Y-17804]